jgi:hypothetical protein
MPCHNKARSAGPGHLSAQPWFCPRGSGPRGSGAAVLGFCVAIAVIVRSGCIWLWAELPALAPGARPRHQTILVTAYPSR